MSEAKVTQEVWVYGLNENLERTDFQEYLGTYKTTEEAEAVVRRGKEAIKESQMRIPKDVVHVIVSAETVSQSDCTSCTLPILQETYKVIKKERK